MEQRKTMTAIVVILIGIILGFFLKNVKEGLIIGLALGLLASGLLRSRNK